MKKLNSLQVIRGIAALLVLLFHATGLFDAYYHYNYFFGLFRHGELGVDLFFVLSGFLIFYIHYKDIEIRDRAKLFFFKRLSRIFPAYWVILFAVMPILFLVPSFGPERIDFITVLKAILLFPQEHENLPLAVSWTLSHELLFYLFFLAVILFKKKLIIPLIVIWQCLCAFSLFNLELGINFLYQFAFDPINLEFIFGVIVAYLVLNNKLKDGAIYFTAGVFLFGVFLINMHFGDYEINRVIAFGLPSALLILGIVSLELTRNIKSNKILVYLGDASYSIYLTHYPTLSFTNKVLMSLNLYKTLSVFVTSTICIIVAVIVGCAFHSIIEKPLLKIGNRVIQGKKKKVTLPAVKEVNI